MVLRGNQGQGMAAVAQHEETGLLTGHKFFNHQFGSGRAERAVKNIIDRFMGGIHGVANDNTLAGGQSVCLDNNGQGLFVQIVMRRFGRGKAAIGGGRNISFGA